MRHIMRRCRVLCAGLLLATVLIGLMPVPPTAAAHSRWCPPETGICTENAFADYFAALDAMTNGFALDIIGYPIDPPRRAPNGMIVQYFERAVMEWHPENPPQYQVLLTRLGAVLIEEREELAMRATQPPVPCAGECVHFAETNHTLRDVFLATWLAYGDLAIFGFPLTEEAAELNQDHNRIYTVQYFERYRFEHHPENPARYQVLLGQLGREALTRFGAEVRSWPVAVVPDFS